MRVAENPGIRGSGNSYDLAHQVCCDTPIQIVTSSSAFGNASSICAFGRSVMAIVQNSMPVRQSACPPIPSGAAARSSAYFVTSNSKQILEGAIRVSRAWVIGLSIHDLERQRAIRLIALAESLIRNEDSSSVGMFNVRTLMCSNCLSLDSAKGQCPGRSLDRCLLLKAISVNKCPR